MLLSNVVFFHSKTFYTLTESTTPQGGVLLIKRNRFVKNQYEKPRCIASRLLLSYSKEYSSLFYTDIQLKTLRHSLKVFNMKINMRRDYVIF